MTGVPERPPIRWRRGLARPDWGEEERAFALLLDALAAKLAEVEGTEVERHSTARRDMADIGEDRERVEREQMDEARDELAAFQAALRDARARAGAGGREEVACDDAEPEQSRMADVLIRYLVRTGYAVVRTEEPGPGHHVYYLRVDWERLEALAAAQEHRAVL